MREQQILNHRYIPTQFLSAYSSQHTCHRSKNLYSGVTQVINRYTSRISALKISQNIPPLFISVFRHKVIRNTILQVLPYVIVY